MNDKQLVAIYAAQFVQNGMLVGLGTGSTANYFIDELARRQIEEGLQVIAVASSVISGIKAQSLGLNLVAFESISAIDLYVDGADEITPDLALLKGRGYDLVKEKLLAKAAKKFIVVADKTKLVNRIGQNFSIPVEVLPHAWKMVKNSLEQAGGNGSLRPNVAKDGLSVSSHGSLILDISFSDALDHKQLNQLINNIPGIVEHGIFSELAHTVLIADNGKIEVRH
ncbi:MAG: ribose-5-phosphate isomerase RpiA [Methylophilaceae bacterium]|nr:ribose-5-phosphate isomerase RpiA [Methylophilaceae bacterium]